MRISTGFLRALVDGGDIRYGDLRVSVEDLGTPLLSDSVIFLKSKGFEGRDGNGLKASGNDRDGSK